MASSTLDLLYLDFGPDKVLSAVNSAHPIVFVKNVIVENFVTTRLALSPLFGGNVEYRRSNKILAGCRKVGLILLSAGRPSHTLRPEVFGAFGARK